MRDIDRRAFLKKVFQIGGIAALHRLGTGAVRDAMAWGIGPAVPAMGPSPGPYASWYQDGQDTCADVDFIIYNDNPAAGGNDAGASPTGKISGADLVGTQGGNLPGSPDGLYRPYDGLDDEMFMTTTCCNICVNDKWSIMWKCGDMATTVVAVQPVILVDAIGNDAIFFQRDDNKFWVFLAGASKLGAAPATVPPSSGIIIMGLWCDGTYVRGGWVADGDGSGPGGQPIKWSDFPAAQRVSATNACDFTGKTFDSNMNILMTRQPHYIAWNFYWLILHSACLIDNNA